MYKILLIIIILLLYNIILNKKIEGLEYNNKLSSFNNNLLKTLNINEYDILLYKNKNINSNNYILGFVDGLYDFFYRNIQFKKNNKNNKNMNNKKGYCCPINDNYSINQYNYCKSKNINTCEDNYNLCKWGNQKCKKINKNKETDGACCGGDKCKGKKYDDCKSDNSDSICYWVKDNNCTTPMPIPQPIKPPPTPTPVYPVPPTPIPPPLGPGGKCPPSTKNIKPADQLDIKDQKSYPSLQIVNNTDEEFLRAFLSVNSTGSAQDPNNTWDSIKKYYQNKSWDGNIAWKISKDSNGNKMASPNSQINSKTINWTNAWDPLGAQISNELIIPKGGFIVIDIPDELQPSKNENLKDPLHGNLLSQFSVIGIKMVCPYSNLDEFKKQFDGRIFFTNDDNSKAKGSPMSAGRYFYRQKATKLEAGIDVVSDLSAVDGVNFDITYQLTNNGNYPYMHTKNSNKNPCDGIKPPDDPGNPNGPGFYGCPNPVTLIEKDGVSVKTLECKPGSQICSFNQYTNKLFKTPPISATSNALKYWNITYPNGNYTGLHYDLGKTKGELNIKNPEYMPVKRYVNDNNNLQESSLLYSYCKNIQTPGEKYVPYCYDYNDVGSSPNLDPPYSLKLIFKELNPGEEAPKAPSGKWSKPCQKNQVCCDPTDKKSMCPGSQPCPTNGICTGGAPINNNCDTTKCDPKANPPEKCPPKNKSPSVNCPSSGCCP